MKATTTLGDALRDLADVCDLNPDWTSVACLFSLGGLRLNMHGHYDASPVDVVRAVLAAAEADQGDTIEIEKTVGFHDPPEAV
jgi:hypothetical protein